MLFLDKKNTFDPVIKLLYLANNCWVIIVLCNMIKTFDPFGSSYLGQVNELFKKEQKKNGSL